MWAPKATRNGICMYVCQSCHASSACHTCRTASDAQPEVQVMCAHHMHQLKRLRLCPHHIDEPYIHMHLWRLAIVSVSRSPCGDGWLQVGVPRAKPETQVAPQHRWLGGGRGSCRQALLAVAALAARIKMTLTARVIFIRSSSFDPSLV